MSATDVRDARRRWESAVQAAREGRPGREDFDDGAYRVFSEPWSRLCFGAEASLRLANDDQRLGAMVAIRVEQFRRDLSWELDELQWASPAAGTSGIGEFGWCIMLSRRPIDWTPEPQPWTHLRNE
jgi:hypothetical protein